MTWRYVPIRKTKRIGRKTYHWYDIHEMFQDGKKISWTTEPVYVGCEELSEVRWALAMMLADSYRVPVMEIKGNKLVERKSK
jgi:hypothetical protein